MSNDSNGPAQDPNAGQWGYGSAESPPRGDAQGQPPAPGWSVPPQQVDPSRAPAWQAEPEQFAEPGSPAPGGWNTQVPVSGQPAHYGPPHQGWTPHQPASAEPDTRPHSWAEQVAGGAEPVGQAWPQQRAGIGDMGSDWRPRIEPSPPSPGRFLPGLLVGLLMGLVVLGPAGYFVGNVLFGKESESDAATGEPNPSSTALPPFEARQVELNREKFDGDLAAMAEPWLPYLSRCVNSSDLRAPRPPKNEVTRVTCQLGNLTVFFVEFKTPEDRNQEFLTRKQQNAVSQQLAPGASAPTHKTGTSGDDAGNYVEFAFKSSAAGAQAFAGVWWDRDGAPLVAARIEAQWVKDLNQSWEPLRDIWQRHR